MLFLYISQNFFQLLRQTDRMVGGNIIASGGEYVSRVGLPEADFKQSLSDVFLYCADGLSQLFGYRLTTQ